MTKPSIAIYREKKPAYYVGADISITLKAKSNLPDWEVDHLEHLIYTILDGTNYEDISASTEFIP